MRPLALAVLGRGLVDPDEPVLTVDDVALTRGQAAFETLRVYHGVAFALPEHLDRLAQSALRLELPPVDRDALTELADQALAAAIRSRRLGRESPLDAAAPADLALRFYWTGGREGEGRATGICLVSPIPDGFDELRERGLRVVSLDLGVDVASRARSPWLLGGVKSTSYAVNVAARSEALRRGADDALLLASDGTVLEGATSNVWWRSGGTLRTPGLDLGILAGVTRTPPAGRRRPAWATRSRRGAGRWLSCWPPTRCCCPPRFVRWCRSFPSTSDPSVQVVRAPQPRHCRPPCERSPPQLAEPGPVSPQAAHDGLGRGVSGPRHPTQRRDRQLAALPSRAARTATATARPRVAWASASKWTPSPGLVVMTAPASRKAAPRMCAMSA